MKQTSAAVDYPTLAAYIAETGDTQGRIAARVGTTQAHISRIAAGDAVPRSLLMARIAHHCHIPLDSFHKAYLAKHAGVSPRAKRRASARKRHSNGKQ